jgi:hypothetical protein
MNLRRFSESQRNSGALHFLYEENEAVLQKVRLKTATAD